MFTEADADTWTVGKTQSVAQSLCAERGLGPKASRNFRVNSGDDGADRAIIAPVEIDHTTVGTMISVWVGEHLEAKRYARLVQ